MYTRIRRKKDFSFFNTVRARESKSQGRSSMQQKPVIQSSCTYYLKVKYGQKSTILYEIAGDMRTIDYYYEDKI